MTGAVLAVVLVLVAALAQPLTAAAGQDPSAYNIDLIDEFGAPRSGISGEHWFGVEPQSGRDVFTRLVLGFQFSLAVALGAAVVEVLIGLLVVAAILRGNLRGMLRPVLLCWALLVPVNLLLEVQKSFLGTGFREPPTPSWGGMLSDAVSFYAIDPAYLLIPLLLLAVTVLAFSLLADGLRCSLVD